MLRRFLLPIWIGILFYTVNGYPELPIEKVVIWGHKLHTHTHSYIHERFYRAFQHLGYSTFWFDDTDNVETFDFSQTLFLTEGQVDKNIPLRQDCFYILHNCDQTKYEQQIDTTHLISLRVYLDDHLTNPNLTKIDECIYYDLPARTIYMPWATDLLPHEIDEMKKRLPTLHKNNAVEWIGTYWGGSGGNIREVTPFKRACERDNHPFRHSNPWVQGLSREEMLEKTLHAFLAPAIVGTWQLEHGYIPCRIFITMSCGQLGVTNSLRVYELFNRKIVYNPNTYKLFYDAKKRLETWTLEDQYELMDLIKEKHTYLNRIDTLLNFLEVLQNNKERAFSSGGSSLFAGPQILESH